MSSNPRVEVFPRADRLESWKEIATYLNRSERTVRRWEEKEGLPVHRLQHDTRGSVYAYASELDDWRESRRQLIAAEPPEEAARAVSPTTTSPGRRWAAAATAIVVMVAAAAGFLWVSRRPAPAEPPNPEAVRALQSGHYAMNAGRVQVQTGIRYYQEAVRLAPLYAPAWTALASAHIAETWFSDRPATETMAQAKREAQQALHLDPSLDGPWRALASASHYLDWEHALAEEQYRKALAINPASSVAWSWYTEFLLDMRRFDEALVAAKRAQDANPRWLEPIMVAGNVHLFTGHFDLAIAHYKRALEIEPNFGLANHFLGRGYLAKGQHKEAIEQLRKSNDLLGQLPFSLADLGYALATTGARAEATQMVADLMHKREQGRYPAFPIAVIQIGLGDTDAALQWLDRAAEERHIGYYLPSVDPFYDRLRSEARFQRLMERMNVGQP